MENSFLLWHTRRMIEETLGGYIRKHRKAAHLTQEQLGVKIQISGRSISEWEKNRTVPSRDSLNRLSNFFRISLDEFKRFINIDALEQEELQVARQIQQANRKEDALALIEKLLDDPQKLNQWIDYGEWLQDRAADED